MPLKAPEAHSARKSARLVEIGTMIWVLLERLCQAAWALVEVVSMELFFDGDVGKSAIWWSSGQHDASPIASPNLNTSMK